MNWLDKFLPRKTVYNITASILRKPKKGEKVLFICDERISNKDLAMFRERLKVIWGSELDTLVLHGKIKIEYVDDSKVPKVVKGGKKNEHTNP